RGREAPALPHAIRSQLPAPRRQEARRLSGAPTRPWPCSRASAPNDDGKSMLGKFRQPQPGQSDLRCREQTRHQKFVAKFDLKDIHTELQLATPAQTQRPNRCWAIV